MSVEVLMLIVGTITAIGVFLGPYLAECVRRKHRKREEHLAQIKDKVFKPLLRRLENYYLPIIERKETNVKTVAVPPRGRPSTIGKEDRIFSSKLEITVGEKDIDNILYGDAKENHFKDLFIRLEDFEERFMRYSEKCLQGVNDLKEKIISNIRLKDYTGSEESYMFAGALAIFLFEKTFLSGRENNYLRIESNGSKKAVKDWNRNYARGDSSEIEECYACIEKLFKEVLKIPVPPDPEPMRHISERAFKECLRRILGDTARKDWGGETSDYYTAHLHLKGQRVTAAFLLKGPARFAPMDLSHLGRNYDQILRLAREPAQVLVVQHCHDILPPVRETLRTFAVQPSRARRYCLIDGRDSLRLLQAYDLYDWAVQKSRHA